MDVPDLGWESLTRYKYVQLPKTNLCTKYQLPILSFKMQRTLMSSLSGFGLWRMLEVPDWGSETLLRYKHVQIPKNNLCTKFQLPTLSFKVQRNLMSLLSELGLWRTLGFLIGDWSPR